MFYNIMPYRRPYKESTKSVTRRFLPPKLPRNSQPQGPPPRAPPARQRIIPTKSPLDLKLLSLRKRFKNSSLCYINLSTQSNFLSACTKRNLIPKGLRIKTKCMTPRPDLTNIKEEFQQHISQAQMTTTRLLLNHLQKSSAILKVQIENILTEMHLTTAMASTFELIEHHKFQRATVHNIEVENKYKAGQATRKLQLLLNRTGERSQPATRKEKRTELKKDQLLPNSLPRVQPTQLVITNYESLMPPQPAPPTVATRPPPPSPPPVAARQPSVAPVATRQPSPPPPVAARPPPPPLSPPPPPPLPPMAWRPWTGDPIEEDITNIPDSPPAAHSAVHLPLPVNLSSREGTQTPSSYSRRSRVRLPPSPSSSAISTPSSLTRCPPPAPGSIYKRSGRPATVIFAPLTLCRTRAGERKSLDDGCTWRSIHTATR